MAVNKKSLNNLKSYAPGKSGNPKGRPPKKKSQESSSDLRELVNLPVDDEISAMLPSFIKAEFLEKIKREKWSLEKLMDFCAIIGSLGGQQSGYSYYREIKDRLYGKSEIEREDNKKGPKSVWDNLQPIETKSKPGRKRKEDYEQEAEVLEIFAELGLDKVSENKESIDAEDESGNDTDDAKDGEQIGASYAPTAGISSIE